MNLESCSGQSMNPGVSLQAGSFRTDRQTKLGNIFTKLKCNVFLRRAQRYSFVMKLSIGKVPAACRVRGGERGDPLQLSWFRDLERHACGSSEGHRCRPTSLLLSVYALRFPSPHLAEAEGDAALLLSARATSRTGAKTSYLPALP